jgi:hypothetical protein
VRLRFPQGVDLANRVIAEKRKRLILRWDNPAGVRCLRFLRRPIGGSASWRERDQMTRRWKASAVPLISLAVFLAERLQGLAEAEARGRCGGGWERHPVVTAE